MATTFLTEKEESLDRQPALHLSYSQVNRHPDFPLDQ